MDKETFIYQATDPIKSIPKFTAQVIDKIDMDDDCNGMHQVDHAPREHTITIKEGIFNDYPTLMSTIGHECVHAGMTDILLVLVNQGRIKEEVADLIHERCAYLAKHLIYSFIQRHDDLTMDWLRLQEENEKTSLSDTGIIRQPVDDLCDVAGGQRVTCKSHIRETVFSLA